MKSIFKKTIVFAFAVFLSISLPSCKKPLPVISSSLPKADMLRESVPVDVLFEKQHTLDAIDPYVIPCDYLSAFDSEDVSYFNSLIDGVLNASDKVYLSDDFEKNERILSAVKKSAYWAFVKRCDFTDGGTAVRLEYFDYYAKDPYGVTAFLEKEFLEIINNSVFEGMNDVDKALSLYNHLGKRISYDFDWVDTYDAERDKYLFHGIGAYDALTGNIGVCHTYAQLLEFALRQVGVECVMLDGVSRYDDDENHSWLIVKFGGEFYHIDLTWDSDQKSDLVGLRYFGMTDEERYETGIITYAESIDQSYAYSCTDLRFAKLRKAYKFEQTGLHKWKIYTLENTVFVYDTQT